LNGPLNFTSNFNPPAFLHQALRRLTFLIAGSFPSAPRFPRVRLPSFCNPALSGISSSSGIVAPKSSLCSIAFSQFADL
jgi:hypothetical protein